MLDRGLKQSDAVRLHLFWWCITRIKLNVDTIYKERTHHDDTSQDTDHILQFHSETFLKKLLGLLKEIFLS